MEGLEGPLLTIITASTPLLLAALGELVTERSGVLNLGVEGMMAVGAVCGFAAANLTGMPMLGVVAAILGGMAIAFLFGLLTLGLVTNQVASGLALTLFGLGLSALIGDAFVGVPGAGMPKLYIPGISDLPIVGPMFFAQDFMTYLAWALAIAVWYFIFRTRGGLVTRLQALEPSSQATPHRGRLFRRVG